MPACLRVDELFHLIERLENLLVLVVGNSDSPVAHSHLHMGHAGYELNVDLIVAELERVVDQELQHDGDGAAIAANQRKLLICRHEYAIDSIPMCPTAAQGAHRLVERIGHMHIFELK